MVLKIGARILDRRVTTLPRCPFVTTSTSNTHHPYTSYPQTHPPFRFIPTMKLKDISRTATFAWDQSSSASPLLATGAAAGALDESFSNESQLEIWAPDFGESQGMYLGGQDSKPYGSITVNSRWDYQRKTLLTPDSTAWHGPLPPRPPREGYWQLVWRLEKSTCSTQKRSSTE